MTTANDLIVVFVALETLSIPLYVLAAFDRRRLALARGRHEVLRARRVLLGDASSTASRSSTARPARRRSPASPTSSPRTRCSSRARSSWASCCCSSGSASRSPRSRSTCGRPTSTRARPRRSPRSCRRPPRPPGFALLLRIFLVGIPLFDRHDWRPAIWALAIDLAPRREHRRAGPDRHQAHARLLVDQPRRLRAHRRRGRRVTPARRPSAGPVGALLPARLRVHDDRRVHRGDGDRPLDPDDRHSLDDYKRLATRRPVLAGLLAFFLLAQAGIPPTGGFIAKLEVFVGRHGRT